MESKNIIRPVKIRLHSSIKHPGQDIEIHELEATGQYIKKSNSVYLKYEEQHNGQKIQTTVKMDKNEALILRSGAVKMRLPFDTERAKSGEYGNGPARMKLLVKTNQLEFVETEKRGEGQFKVVYELHAEESLVGTYTITITYSEGIK